MKTSALTRVLLAVTFGAVLAALPACSTQSDGESTQQPVAATPAPTAPPTADEQSPELAFRTWLAASREPDAAVACSYLTDGLIERMLAEMKASGLPAADCVEMIESTAALYKATGQSQDVEVDTVSATAEAAELRVAYDGGSCGRVVMERETSRWVMNEYSEEDC
ncbi:MULTISPECIES: hypothetical protein [unclassified Microbacterium]|uniref:hypothetical protein n=1 Tax=unclassified Microbacterium TaxID=2609290 RepID=UPI0012FAA00A|nr:hypothetical protein [Microbacterium sp. MAH-37]MVQ42510.1 hypothetical protein [Microbacterium sp. MAH-37]